MTRDLSSKVPSDGDVAPVRKLSHEQDGREELCAEAGEKLKELSTLIWRVLEGDSGYEFSDTEAWELFELARQEASANLDASVFPREAVEIDRLRWNFRPVLTDPDKNMHARGLLEEILRIGAEGRDLYRTSQATPAYLRALSMLDAYALGYISASSPVSIR